MIRSLAKLALAWAAAMALWASGAQALSLQRVGTFEQPIYVTSDPGNPERLFVVERTGAVIAVEGESRWVFADLRPLVSCCEGERGLLSIALAPDFDASGRFYVDYTGIEEPGVGAEEGAIHVAEMRAIENLAPLTTFRNLLTIPHPNYSNHNGGQLQFGPEGDLFVSTGDGGGGNDVEHNAQSLDSLLGKILRIDPEPSGLRPYTVPPDNPFAASAPPYDAIWSYGLRNPFRFSFDRLTGDLLIGDVGQEKWEEVDYAPAPGLGRGWNYGWNCMEGGHEGPATDPQCAAASPQAFTAPIFEYAHAEPEEGGAHGCAIIGGYVARGPGLGSLYGRYLYGDLCVGELRSFSPLDPAGDRGEGLEVPNLNSFGEDSCGRLYAVSGNGPVYRLVGSGEESCQPPAPPAPPLQPSYIGIKAISRNVVRHRRAQVTAWVGPCRDRHGTPVTLWRGRQQLGTRHLGRACSVRFRPRVDRRSTFRAVVKAESPYAEATSRRLTVRPRSARWARHRRHRLRAP